MLAKVLRSRYGSARRTCSCVNFDPDAQLAFVTELAQFSEECDWPEHATNGHDYYSQNESFAFSSASLLHSVVRRFVPQKTIEVGAGMSTLLLVKALDLNARQSGLRGELVTIDPYPTAAVQGLSNEMWHSSRQRCKAQRSKSS